VTLRDLGSGGHPVCDMSYVQRSCCVPRRSDGRGRRLAYFPSLSRAATGGMRSRPRVVPVTAPGLRTTSAAVRRRHRRRGCNPILAPNVRAASLLRIYVHIRRLHSFSPTLSFLHDHGGCLFVSVSRVFNTNHLAELSSLY